MHCSKCGKDIPPNPFIKGLVAFALLLIGVTDVPQQTFAQQAPTGQSSTQSAKPGTSIDITTRFLRGQWSCASSVWAFGGNDRERQLAVQTDRERSGYTFGIYDVKGDTITIQVRDVVAHGEVIKPRNGRIVLKVRNVSERSDQAAIQLTMVSNDVQKLDKGFDCVSDKSEVALSLADLQSRMPASQQKYVDAGSWLCEELRSITSVFAIKLSGNPYGRMPSDCIQAPRRVPLRSVTPTQMQYSKVEIEGGLYPMWALNADIQQVAPSAMQTPPAPRNPSQPSGQIAPSATQTPSSQGVVMIPPLAQAADSGVGRAKSQKQATLNGTLNVYPSQGATFGLVSKEMGDIELFKQDELSQDVQYRLNQLVSSGAMVTVTGLLLEFCNKTPQGKDFCFHEFDTSKSIQVRPIK